jgi:hypothetical protein
MTAMARRAPHPLPRSALPPPERLQITVSMIDAYRLLRWLRQHCRCGSSHNGDEEPCAACLAAGVVEERLRALFGLPAWELVVTETIESPNDRAAFGRFRALESGLRVARRLDSEHFVARRG